ncbi:DUF397 domain-containing protein [Amycolatopsis sp. H20-H5]|uniref:DUF397 domain-containing protein n=1 Tax=Amycolatopsis sp. H20-H5 TaxID=3046309 RepID=UPI002DB56D92|nr:DUF397 domain-containing protein [Amycolatopsis sp. H20-H5]MEC3981129.1 DUF397 domain-containing protein [Amycolatopsis sp. H20-H5]
MIEPEEASTVDLASARWRKSSHSGGDGHDGNCVEVAQTPGAVAIRDSKSPASGALVIPAPAWRQLVATLPPRPA